MKIKIIVALLIGGTIFAMVTSDPDEKENDQLQEDSGGEAQAVDKSTETEEDDNSLPKISNEAVTMTEVQSEEDPMVADAFIQVEEGTVTIAMVVPSTTSEEDARKLLENAARLLASTAAIDNDGMKGARKDHLGELWDHYKLNLIAGTSVDETLAQGAKVTTARGISW